jgi:hypothetical protein
LCDWRISVARLETERDFLIEAVAAYPTADHFKVQLPFALALAVEATKFRYDADFARQ